MNTVLAVSLSRANQLIPFHVFQVSAEDSYALMERTNKCIHTMDNRHVKIWSKLVHMRMMQN